MSDEDKKTRKPGQKKADYSDEDTRTLLKKSKQLVRTDFGGSSQPTEVIRKKLEARGIPAGPKSCEAIKELLEEQVESCRKRIFPRIDEAIKRLGEVGETLP